MTMRLLCLRRTAVIFVLGLVAAACGGEAEEPEGGEPQAAAPGEVTITFGTDAIDVPVTIESEPVAVTLENETEQPQNLFFGKLLEGVTPEDFQDVRSEEEFFSLIVPAGSTQETDPGGNSTVTIEFPEGTYVALGEGDEPAPSFFDVVPAAGPAVQEPAPDLEVEVGEFYFRLPESIPAGTVTVLLTNAGEQGHEFGGELKDGNGAAHGEHAGFHVLAPAPGGRMWIEMTFEAATYHVACFLPDVDTGKPHIRLGMEAEVTAE